MTFIFITKNEFGFARYAKHRALCRRECAIVKIIIALC